MLIGFVSSLFLKEGIVAEQGKPQELKQQKGIYKHMVDMQMQSNAWKYQ